MKFEQIRLENFKCYDDADLGLEHGVTVIHGVNGSGKSSLLEACFFALYGPGGFDRSLDEFITIGAEEAAVELWFAHAGVEYRIERRIKLRGERAQTTACVLDTPDGTIDGVNDVESHIRKLLRMDADAFVNCAYVRQGEVNKLINASARERQSMIDDLLQLGKLEEYRERASDARLGVKSVLDDRHGSLTQLDDQIAEKEAKNFHAQLNDAETKLAELDTEIERIEGNVEKATKTRDDAEAILKAHEQKREELAELAEEIENVRESIRSDESERDALKERIRNLKEATEELRDDLDEQVAASELSAGTEEAVEAALDAVEQEDDDLHEQFSEQRVEVQTHTGNAEAHEERAAELEAEAEQKRTKAEETAAAIETDEQTLTERREKVSTLKAQLATERARFDDAPIDFGDAADFRDQLTDERTELTEKETDLRAKITTLRSNIEDAEALLAEGKCPECGQPVEDSPHVDSLTEDKKTLEARESELEALEAEKDALEERIETVAALREAERTVADVKSQKSSLEQLVTEREETLEERRETVEQLREQADELEIRATEKREAAKEAEAKATEARKQVADLNQQRTALRERKARLEEMQTLLSDIADNETKITQQRERREHLSEINEERRERLADITARKRELEDEFDEQTIENARNETKRARTYLEKAEPKLAELAAERDQLTGTVGALENAIEELENLRERRDRVADAVSHLESLYDEAEDLQNMYGDLRGELRQRNVETLERMLNEVFDLVYQNDSYSRIELDGDYELTVYQKDGEPLAPEQLSGGERAIFNLSLRCAIYRLLSEGIDGAAPMPPLILDEPTVFLDDGHVTQLIELIDSMRTLGVEQIVVVSHDEELVGAADDLVVVEKDSTSNRSHAERETRELPAELL
ncbi:DNA double-strand break repair ATPase Rad50 [Haladaptatus sp. DJG-WS-42]|uniref:DNA double-strand break repair ATPase Rad50 n=1 Tax=Haladaptatus sp. DJG-WS-42 TaxID=3120516 RepID=UPI0030CFE277